LGVAASRPAKCDMGTLALAQTLKEPGMMAEVFSSERWPDPPRPP
jgi:hypothetical protein